MRKKLLSLFLAVTLVTMVFSGCTSSNSSKTTQASKPASEEKAADPSAGYPNKPVQLIVPWSPGGATDVIFRLVSEYAQKELGQPIAIVNVNGAGGTVGATQVKDSKPDGYTLLGGHDSLITSYMEGVADFSYDAFEAIALLTTTPNIATVNAKSNWNTMKEVLEDAKSRPGQITWAASLGSTSHYFALGIMAAGGVSQDDIRIVGSPGTKESITNLLGGHVDVAQTQISSAGSYVESSDLKFVGVAHDRRLPQAPDVPTLIEQGIDYVQGTNRGIFAPENTPIEIIKKVNEAYKKAMENPELIKKLEDLGNIVNYKNTEEYKLFLEKSYKEIEEISKQASK